MRGVAAEDGEHTDNQRDHARAVATSGLETLDELLDLPYLDLGHGVVSIDAR